MKLSREYLKKDLLDLQQLMEQLNPISIDLDDQIAIKIFSHLIQQRKYTLASLIEVTDAPCDGTCTLNISKEYSHSL